MSLLSCDLASADAQPGTRRSEARKYSVTESSAIRSSVTNAAKPRPILGQVRASAAVRPDRPAGPARGHVAPAPASAG